MDLEHLIGRYKSLGINDVQDYGLFNNISIVHHSTRIEGSTLTELETRILITDGLTPNGKPLSDSLMVTDHYTALLFVLREAKSGRSLSAQFIKEVNALVMKSTGGVVSNALGSVNVSKGEYRNGGVFAGKTYFPSHAKAVKMIDDMVSQTDLILTSTPSMLDILNLSFAVHFNFVNIHPFFDGKGRTSRLLMNFIQAKFDLPLAIVHADSKREYVDALNQSIEKDDIQIFFKFMAAEYSRLLKAEIIKFEEMQHPNKGRGFHLMF